MPSLNDLHRLIEDAKTRKEAAEAEAQAKGTPVDEPVAPHTLGPDALLSSHLGPFYSVQNDIISAQLADVQRSNETFMEEITQQRTELQHLVDGLGGIVGDLEKSAGLMRRDEVQGLIGEVRGIEMELRG